MQQSVCIFTTAQRGVSHSRSAVTLPTARPPVAAKSLFVSAPLAAFSFGMVECE